MLISGKVKGTVEFYFLVIQLASFFICIFISSESSHSFCYCNKSLICRSCWYLSHEFRLLLIDLYLLAEDENPSKAAKVDIPSAHLVGGMVPGPLGAGYPPRPLAAMQPMYSSLFSTISRLPHPSILIFHHFVSIEMQFFHHYHD